LTLADTLGYLKYFASKKMSPEQIEVRLQHPCNEASPD
jgi:hypothetical protein